MAGRRKSNSSKSVERGVEGEEQCLAGRMVTKSSESVERIEGEEGAGQWMAGRGEDGAVQEMVGRVENISSESIERIEEIQGSVEDMTDKGEANQSFSVDEEAINHGHITKKPKCLESSVQDDQFPSQTISSSLLSECPDSMSSESDDKLDHAPLPSSPSPQKIINSVTYDHLPQDYTLTEFDTCAHCLIQYADPDDLLVWIDDIQIKKRYLDCLLDDNRWLDDEVISAYICCLKEQAEKKQNKSKVYYANPFVTGLLKQHGETGIDESTGLTKVIKEYLNHDMVHLPINIKNLHWYLATINFEKCDIQVLDSLCWEHNRADLIYTLQGLQYHLEILKSEDNSIDPKWKDIDFTQWTITEILKKPIQYDSSSCGLFTVKFMEYWNGHALSCTITQEIIKKIRKKLAAMLFCWKNNKAAATTTIKESDYGEDDPNDMIMSDTPFVENQSKEIDLLTPENKYNSLMSIISNLSLRDLVGGLCSYIRSIKSAEDLEKIWVQSSLPYPISLTLKNLQQMLNDELTMDFNCFNLVVRTIMFDNIETVRKKGGLILNHCLDMQFWMICDFGRHKNYRKELDVEQLANSVRSWPGMKYNVSSFNSIHIPILTKTGGYILFILHKDTKSVYILDPTPIEDMYKLNPFAKYVKRIEWIGKHLQKAMSKAYPGSTWNEDIFLWQQKIVHDISFYKRELSGFLVTLFMSTWNDGNLQLPFIKDLYELRKQMVGQLLTLKQNTCEQNMPTGVLDFISCIRKIQNK